MATISELVEKYSKVPGDLRLKRVGWGATHWFAPYYASEYGNLHGLNEKGQSCAYSPDSSEWKLWQEPKRKRKMAPYLLRRSDGLVQLSLVFYETDIEAGKDWEGTRNLIIRRMTELEVEVDE